MGCAGLIRLIRGIIHVQLTFSYIPVDLPVVVDTIYKGEGSMMEL